MKLGKYEELKNILKIFKFWFSSKQNKEQNTTNYPIPITRMEKR